MLNSSRLKSRVFDGQAVGYEAVSPGWFSELTALRSWRMPRKLGPAQDPCLRRTKGKEFHQSASGVVREEAIRRDERS
jgi:hypothetical protein